MVVSYGVPPSTSGPLAPRDPYGPIPDPYPTEPFPAEPFPTNPFAPVVPFVNVFTPYSPRELEFMSEITRLRVEVSRLQKAVRVLAGEE